MLAVTPDQIANWREILKPVFGTYALLMPVAQIEAIREQMQGAIDRAYGGKHDPHPAP